MRPQIHSPRMALVRQIVACLALVLAAFAFAACGEDSPQGPKIPADISDDLIAKLDTVKSRAADGSCEGDDSAESALAAVQVGVDGLPEDTDQEIVDGLNELVGDLDERIAQSCDDEAAAADPETSSAETSEETSTEETTTTTDETDPTTTEEPETTPPDDTEPEPEEPQTPPVEPPGNGPDGSGPPGQSDDQGSFDTEGGGIAPRAAAQAAGR